MAAPKILPGIQPAEAILELEKAGVITTAVPFADDQVQPASLDLRLGRRAFRVRASFLPGLGRRVVERLEHVALHEIDLTQGAVLETGCVYIAEILEGLALPADLAASANPKSSTGRLDVFTRVIVDGSREFDIIDAGYTGPLYAEISPRTFPVLVRTGARLSQVRFRAGVSRLDDAALTALHSRESIVTSNAPSIQDGVAVSVDLSGFDSGGLIGYRAKRHTGLVDVDRIGAYAVRDFWEPLYGHGEGSLVLDPGQFYILASKEAVHVPPDYAAEMVPFDPLVGEFRVHYAGFFDPGFGHAGAGGAGSRAVLEVRSHDVPFIIEDGQIVGRLVYERMAARPRVLYGAGAGSNYQAQGLKLSKHFRMGE
ncbi:MULTISPECIES: 2'-deoxycytidine 5'-triphosphate deaminase [unclassified Chelatococcus]|uniref:2'-deoxycytidine 5'-triphosphate deaminase n=1 Tax=unclassified Chelatococcus TaxID=2638111 RepID=UPI001BD048F4|nr:MULTISPECIES: 2'-deoxycytidine 5'-triphosphate deaminase [unclassified Chelatococcus]CAH1652980.1 dCTP deaminase [Hyphomicrobiales bacterium]MBS7740058.1 2'-deoxycytidine 5'-triphosphate deaminase [Chelatococcus sp. HY11]MBX3545113.1 2'-deoxycytidine 5'-triphosphate deaminase [Chelatococcus sp.]MCO5078641.1 2'-deoxycytidine 5'-triphosphate deaminase [Chelatococcus sp.]CAH1685830.1 dCTP deaminase [Hyphomicrobiales bacterium]